MDEFTNSAGRAPFGQGDSFTAGTSSPAVERVIPGDSYVQKLEFLLRERYPEQSLTLTNAGVPGQFMDQIEDRVVNPALELGLKGQATPGDLLTNATLAIDREYLSIANER